MAWALEHVKFAAKVSRPSYSLVTTSRECRADVSLWLFRSRRLGQRLCEVVVAPPFARFQTPCDTFLVHR